MNSGYVSVVIAMLIWGSVGIFGRFAHETALTIVTVRVTVAALCLVLLHLRTKGVWNEIRKQFRIRTGWIVAGGIVLACNWLFFFEAINLTNVANAVLSYYTAPVIVTILSSILLKERMSTVAWWSIGLAFFGTILMNPIRDVSHMNDLLGVISGLIAACFYAFVTICGKKTTHMEPKSLTMVQTAIAACILIPVFCITEPHVPTASSLLIMAAIALVHTAMALSLYFRGLSTTKVSHVGVLGYLDPLSAILYAFLFFHEVPSPLTIVGGFCILLSSYMILRKSS